MKSFQRKWQGLEITIITVIVLLLLLLAYLNWAIAILALIIVVAAYLVNYNTIHHRRRLARGQFVALMPYKTCQWGLLLLINKVPSYGIIVSLQTGLR